MAERIIYSCKKCGWSATITAQWADIKPRYCGNSKCTHSKKKSAKTKKSFASDPEALGIRFPMRSETPKVVKKPKAGKRKKYKEMIKEKKNEGKGIPRVDKSEEASGVSGEETS